MHIESVKNRSSPPCILLRESYREGGKVKKRTLANLTDWPPELVAAFLPALSLKWKRREGQNPAVRAKWRWESSPLSLLPLSTSCHP